jgi:chemotaxis protein histidine kinase CheA
MRERARMMRGRISVQSRPGEGTRIEVRVPIPPQVAEADESLERTTIPTAKNAARQSRNRK